jgi:hypothetical protein
MYSNRGGSRGGFRGSADPQLIFVDKIGLFEIFFLFLDLDLDSWRVGPSELLIK